MRRRHDDVSLEKIGVWLFVLLIVVILKGIL